MKNIPEFDFDISQATQYILESELAQKALENPPFPNFANICRDVIKQLSKLSSNCNMPEFTNHGLQHICSLIKRATEWGLDAGWLILGKTKKAYALSSKEAGYLLLALMLHDIGMLSQDPKELPDGQTINTNQGFLDIATWVRRTHVVRLPKLVQNLLNSYLENDKKDEIKSHIDVIVHIAASHNFWPWDENFITPSKICKKVKVAQERINALNAIVAVCDLLDEDSNRCDSITLLEHKYGSTVNRAHWYRHALTVSVDGVRKNGVINIKFRNLPDTPDDFQIVFRALRNHFRLVLLYNGALEPLKAKIEQINFQPGSGLPEVDSVSEQLGGWKYDIDFRYCMTARILETFMPEARNEASSEDMKKRLQQIGLETMDLAAYDEFLHPEKPYMPEEKLIFAIVKELHLHGGKSDEIDQLNTYARDMVEQAYLSGMVGKVKMLCTFLLEQAGEYIEPEEWYWIFAYKLLLYERKYEDEILEKMLKVPSSGCYSSMMQVIWSLLNLGDMEYLKDKDFFSHLETEWNVLDFSVLKKDGPTTLLVQLLIDAFYFHLDKIGQEYVSRRLHKICEEQKDLEKTVEDECYRLQYQLGIVDSINLLNPKDQLFAKVWNSYMQMDMQQLDESLKCISKYIDQNHPSYVAVQKIYNITRWQRENECGKNKKKIEEELDKSASDMSLRVTDKKTSVLTPDEQPTKGNKSEEKTDQDRILQLEKDNPQNGLHADRLDVIQGKIREMELNFYKGQASHEDATLNQLILLERMQALRNWDLVNVIVLRRYEAEYHKLIGLSVLSTSNIRKEYKERQLTKAVVYSIEGQLTCFESKKDGYWIGLVSSFDGQTKENIFERLLHWKAPIAHAIIRSWLEELGGYVPVSYLPEFVDWIVCHCNKIMQSTTVFYAFPMTTVRYLFTNLNMTNELWGRLEEVFMDTLKDEHYWQAHYTLCSQMLSHLRKDKQMELLKFVSEHYEEKAYYANVIINMAVRISEEHTDLSSFCARRLEERARKYPDNLDYRKYKRVIEQEKISELPKPDVEDICSKIQVIFEERAREEKIHSSATLSMIEKAAELLNNENWSVASQKELDKVFKIILSFSQEEQEHLMANEVFDLFRMLYSLAKDEKGAKKAIEVAFRMNICLNDVERCEEIVKQNKKRMFLSTNLNNGYSYGFMLVVNNLIEYMSDEQLEQVAMWVNRSFVYAEEICEYHYAYFLIYLLKYAQNIGNSTLESLSQVGVAQLKLKLSGQQERSYEKKNDTLRNVLSAWKSYHDIQIKKDKPLDVHLPQELSVFIELGNQSCFKEKQEICMSFQNIS